MQNTFEAAYKEVILKAPNTPLPVAMNCVNRAYQRALDLFPWSGLRGESEFIIPAAYSTGTVTVTQSSTTVTGALTTWTSAMIGRQFFINGLAPYYTIADVTGTGTLTLDRPYGGANAAGASYTIQLVYVTPASDFLHFTVVRDIENNWRFRSFNKTQEWLDRVDAQRASTGTPWCLATATFTSSPPRYEIWPRPSVDGKTYSYRYIKRIADLSAPSDTTIYPIRTSGLVEGALAELALWPGLPGSPNTYFNPTLHQVHETRFQEALTNYDKEDQAIRLSDVSEPENTITPPMDARYWQEHALPALS